MYTCIILIHEHQNISIPMGVGSALKKKSWLPFRGLREAMRCQSMGSGGGFRWRKMIGKWMGKRSIYVVKTILKKAGLWHC